ncbi:MAG TPA: DNA-formamidopyrimidine glycosylase family protein, partial [bacterium]|nr:DNA-formamidopyrimidine glycosylase family protein [bacterium]
MPELPEVESVAQGLKPDLVGKTIATLEIHWPKWLKHGRLAEAQRELPGQKITGVERRGKYIVFRLSKGGTLISHLRMTGRWLVDPEEPLSDRHKSATLHLKGGRQAIFYDVRKFGRGAYYRKGEPIPELEELGPEPLD